MPDKKISDLTELTDAAPADILPIVDISETETKKISVENLVKKDDTKITFVASVYAGSSQNIANSTYTVINYDTETYDRNGDYDTANKKYVCPKAGYYRVVANVTMQYTAACYNRLNVTKNNSQISFGAAFSAAGGGYSGADLDIVLYCAANDYIQVQIYQNSGSTRATQQGAAWSYVNIYQL